MLSLSAYPAHQFHNLRSDQLPGVEVVRGYHSGPIAKWQFVPMVRISALISGTVRIWSHGRAGLVRGGETVVNAPGSGARVVERLSETTETLSAYISPHLFDAVAAPAGGPCAAQLEVHVVAQKALVGAMQRLAEAIGRHAAAAELRSLLGALIGIACSSVHDPATRTLPGGPLRPEIARARQIIQERFAQTISLGALADGVGLSKFHLLRLFREEIGTTPHAYQLQLRISCARE
ncbi:MAG: hypothetical protein AUG04_08125, partial [Deltaproteobacteria bacterium 13_1_20CM_2_69_21]